MNLAELSAMSVAPRNNPVRRNDDVAIHAETRSTIGRAHGKSGGTGGGVSGSIPIMTSQKLAKASETSAIGTPARA